MAFRGRAFDAVGTFVVIVKLIDFGSGIFVDVYFMFGTDVSLGSPGLVVGAIRGDTRWLTYVTLRSLDNCVVKRAGGKSWANKDGKQSPRVLQGVTILGRKSKWRFQYLFWSPV